MCETSLCFQQFHPGLGVGLGNDYTLYALKEGIVTFKQTKYLQSVSIGRHRRCLCCSTSASLPGRCILTVCCRFMWLTSTSIRYLRAIRAKKAAESHAGRSNTRHARSKGRQQERQPLSSRSDLLHVSSKLCRYRSNLLSVCFHSPLPFCLRGMLAGWTCPCVLL